MYIIVNLEHLFVKIVNGSILSSEILNYAGRKIIYKLQGKHQDFMCWVLIFFLFQIFPKISNFKIIFGK